MGNTQHIRITGESHAVVSGYVVCAHTVITKAKELNWCCTYSYLHIRKSMGWIGSPCPLWGSRLICHSHRKMFQHGKLFLTALQYWVMMVRLGGTWKHDDININHLQHIIGPQVTTTGHVKLPQRGGSYWNDWCSVQWSQLPAHACELVLDCSVVKHIVGMVFDWTSIASSHYGIVVSVCNDWGNSKVKYRGVLSG